MSFYLLIPALLLHIILRPSAATTTPRPHICIIGGGISSASAAHFLTENPLNPSPNITLFEKSSTLGGRISSLHIPTSHRTIHVEAGASIIAADNRLMRDFTALLNLSHKTLPSATLGLWTGSEFAIRTHPTSPLRTKLAFLRRYGLPLLNLRSFVSDLLRRFVQLYPVKHAIWPAHSSVEDIFAPCEGLFDLTQVNFQGIVDVQFAHRFAKEMVSAITRVNYGQDVGQMNAFAGSIGLAGSGNDLWAVEGGNVQVVQGLVKRAGVNVMLDTKLTRVEFGGDNKRQRYVVHGERGEWECDAVVLAAPYELSDIQLPPAIARKLDVGRVFHRTHATFVRGHLNSGTFGDDPPDAVLTVEGADEPFTSVGLVSPRNGSEEAPIFKVFSRKRLDSAAKARIFQTDAETIAEYPWLAYPAYSPPEKFAPFDVDPEGGVFIYTSPIESAGSAMEMSAISGANAAALLREKLGLRRREDLDSTVKEEL